uniref:probable disease resistance protein At5g66900 isoform X2 n=1 Tax=Erigeron canadensis TaxID=72917 RepID=UPI001CB95D1D|nr:probable disease resistance protein At5g66900 isoform X2 [Erigeron canadensis]
MAAVIQTALELAFLELLKAVVGRNVSAAKFITKLDQLEKTLKSIEPIFYDSSRLNQVLDRPETEIKMFISYLEEGKMLILKCSRIKFWNVHQNSLHSNKLIQLNNELLRFFQVELHTDMMMIGVHDLTVKMNEVPSTLTSRGHPNHSGSCSVPLLPNGIVGFDSHLDELKDRLLKDDDQVLVVSAPGGYGKTTLAKMLCHEKNIKDIFGENILYVTVSIPSSFKLVVQKLFEHFGENHCDLETDDEARHQLEKLMPHMGSDKILLVLDDVWSESESIIQDLRFPMPGYKILVTSRFLFPRFHSTFELTLMNEEDARTLFCYLAFPNDGIPVNVPDDIVNKIVKLCRGLPLALTAAAASLSGQPLLKWRRTLKIMSDGHPILHSNSSIILSQKSRIDALDELPIVKECFLDMGLFPADERIAAMALVDMWVELYNLDDEGMYTSDNLIELSLRSLINLSSLRKEVGELDGYCDGLYVTKDVLLRELAIHLSSQEPVAERKRLFVEVHGNEFPTWWIEQIAQPINAQILSISTDETFVSNWYDLIAPKVEVLALNVHSEEYTLPQFIERMHLLKVLRITSYDLYPSQLHNLSVMGYLSNLKRIRFEHVSISSSIQPIFALQNLRKLSFVLCEIGNALISCTTKSPPMLLPNLTEIEIDRCYDIKELPSELCNLVQLKKLSLTDCHQLEFLPEELGSLSNLVKLGLRCCTKLQELPQSIGSLNKLIFLDISDCSNISTLPAGIGELCGLRVLKMSGCRRLQELPMSMSKLWQLEEVICDEEMLNWWMNHESKLYNLNIKVVEDDDRFESFMENIHEEAPSIGCMVHERHNSQSCGSDFSYDSLPSYCDVAPRCGSPASEYNGAQNVSNLRDVVLAEVDV